MEEKPKKQDGALYFGILGAAWIAPMGLIEPAKSIEGVKVHAIAARDKKRALDFAKKYQIPVVHNTYEDVLADPDIDAVYVPLPNSYHKEWVIRALKAGKQVLCEKPMACNEEEVQAMFEAAKENDCLLVEAFHWRFHPLAKRVKEILNSGELGKIKSVHASFCIPIFSSSDIRYNWELGGGATMDTGCYAINVMRFLCGDNIAYTKKGYESELEMKIINANTVTCYPQIDKHMKGIFSFTRRQKLNGDGDNDEIEQNENDEDKEKETSKQQENEQEKEKEKEEGKEAIDGKEELDTDHDIIGSFECSIFHIVPKCQAKVKGDKGELNIMNWIAPSYYHKLTKKIYNNPENNDNSSTTQKQGGGTKWWMVPKTPKDKITTESTWGGWNDKNTYWYQLNAFVTAVKAGISANSSIEETLEVLPFYPYHDAIRNARAIDLTYEAAGLKKRGTTQ